MFYKGILQSYEPATNTGTIYLPENEIELVFSTDDLSNLRIEPQLGERVKCLMEEKHGVKRAKFIVRLDFKNTREQKPLNETYYQRIEPSSHPIEQVEKVTGAPDSVLGETESMAKRDSEAEVLAIEQPPEDTISEQSNPTNHNLNALAHENVAEIEAIRNANECLNKPIQTVALVETTACIKLEKHNLVDSEQINVTSAATLLQTAHDHPVDSSQHQLSTDAIDLKGRLDTEIDEHSFTKTEVSSTAVERQSQVDDSKSTQPLEALDPALEIKEIVYSVPKQLLSVFETSELKPQDAFKIDPLLSKESCIEASQPIDQFKALTPHSVQAVLVAGKISELMDSHDSMEHLKNQHVHIAKAEASTKENHRPSASTLGSTTPILSAQIPNQNVDKVSALAKLKNKFAYKHYAPKHQPRPKKKERYINPWMIVSVVVLLVLVNLAVFGFTKYSQYKAEQKAKAKLYLLEQEKIIADQRNQMGHVPTKKVLSEKALDDLLGKDREK